MKRDRHIKKPSEGRNDADQRCRKDLKEMDMPAKFICPGDV